MFDKYILSRKLELIQEKVCIFGISILNQNQIFETARQILFWLDCVIIKRIYFKLVRTTEKFEHIYCYLSSSLSFTNMTWQWISSLYLKSIFSLSEHRLSILLHFSDLFFPFQNGIAWIMTEWKDSCLYRPIVNY